MAPTLLICLYIAGHSERGSRARNQTLAIAEEDIQDYLATNNGGNIILGGDLNTTIDDMEMESINGSYFFEYLLGLNRSSNRVTSHHRNGEKEIDFIFSDAPVID
jgi:endonuclease/exonuclease/phosphatase (EEP) superfamily protein YafD